jgi:hypothetical protein
VSHERSPIKADIAAVVRSVVFPPGGMCWYRALVGLYAWQTLKIPAEICGGGMIYRTGPDPIRDALAFYGPGNYGCFQLGGFTGHAWLRSGSDLIDFSVGDWREPVKHLEEVGPQMEPLIWAVPRPPAFFGALGTS